MNLLNSATVMQMLNVSINTLTIYLNRRDDFPEPAIRVGTYRLWDESEIRKFGNMGDASRLLNTSQVMGLFGLKTQYSLDRAIERGHVPAAVMQLNGKGDRRWREDQIMEAVGRRQAA